MRALMLLIIGLITLSATALAEPIRLSEPVVVTDDYEVFGSPIGDPASGMSLSELLAQADDMDGKEVRVTTRVAKVCQKKGCFFVAQEGASLARVSFKDYGFFVPTDSANKQVTLIGTFSRKDVTPEQAAHYAEDLGEAPAESAPDFEYAIVATSVLIPKS